MKTRTILLSLAVLFGAFAVCLAAENVNMGTCKLNEAKSKVGPVAVKNTTVVYDAAGDSVKVTVDGVDADGKPTHNEWTGKFDGKDYPLTGEPTSDTRAYTQVNDHTLELTNKKRRQDHHHRSRGRLGRRQEPHGHHSWNGCPW